MSDGERRYAEDVAREWLDGCDPGVALEWRDMTRFADLLQRERAGLLARAEAAEAALADATALGGTLTEHEASKGQHAVLIAKLAAAIDERDEAVKSFRRANEGDTRAWADIRAKLAAADARVADTRLELDENDSKYQTEREQALEERANAERGLRARAEKAEVEADRLELLATNVGRKAEEYVERVNAAEAAAGQMRAALDDALEALHEGDHAVLRKTIRTALATDAGRGYLSPEQVARERAGARDGALADVERALIAVHLWSCVAHVLAPLKSRP